MAQTIQEAQSVDAVTHAPTAKDVADLVNDLIAHEADAKTAMKDLKDVYDERVKSKGFNSKAIKTLMVLKKKAPEEVAHFLRELLLGIEGLNLNPQGELPLGDGEEQKAKVVNLAGKKLN